MVNAVRGERSEEGMFFNSYATKLEGACLFSDGMKVQSGHLRKSN